MVEFQGADDFFTTVAEGGGKAYRFTDIDGIGPATADKITSIRGVQNPDDVAEMSADELSDKAGISHSRATKAIKGGGGNPNVSKQDNTGTVSAAGISKRQGDFWVEYTEMDKARARNDTQSRSEEAVRTDDRKRAPVTTDYEKWKKNPGKWDFPGVDTPTNEPNLLPKDVKRGDPNTADFDESGEAEFDEQEQDPFPRVVDSPSGIEILETGEDRVPATDVTRSVPNPDTFAPGLAPEDFEEDEPEPGPDVMGPEPSSLRLSQDERDNLAEQAPTSVLEMQGQAQPANIQTGSDTGNGTVGQSANTNQGSTGGKPAFREPNIGLYNTGEQFEFTYESNRAGTGLVSRSGVITRVTDDKLEVDVGNSNHYEIYSTGRVISISDNFNRTMVGYTVVD
jgi:hypothetical protein